MNGVGELIDGGFLSTDIIDSDFGVWDTSVVSGLRIRLSSAAPVASGWSSTHWLFVMFIIFN
jgi:hypothetical protein